MKKIFTTILILCCFSFAFAQDTTIQVLRSNASSSVPGFISQYPVLYIANGYEVNSLNNLNPDDVKEITVLQGTDEKAISKYGIRAKNGVIEIVLKRSVSKRKLKKILNSPKTIIPDIPAERPKFEKVEIAPLYKGNLQKFIIDNLVAQKDENDIPLTGKVTLQLIVNTNGTINDIIVDQHSISTNKILVKEAIRVIKLTDGEWIGGVQNGKKLERCFHHVDIEFK